MAELQRRPPAQQQQQNPPSTQTPPVSAGASVPAQSAQPEEAALGDERLQPAARPSDQSILTRLTGGWRWASEHKLKEAQERILVNVSCYLRSRFVGVRLWNSKVYTLTATTHSEDKEHPVPYVLVHGFAAGSAMWAGNFTALANKRTVHAFDLLGMAMGFARSSRPMFNRDATLAELEFVQSIEDWRKEMGIERMILVGHSFGGYLASSYALEHSQRVRHLVLVDPWGFPDRPLGEQPHIPPWMKLMGTVMSTFNPLAALRLAGPFGPSVVKRLRSDLGTRYALEDPDAIYEYIYQCNAPTPTGEIAFNAMTKKYGWARRPMIHRFGRMDPRVPVTFIYGSKSWIDAGPAYEIQARRPDSYVDVQIVSGAGHHVYADAAPAFNELLHKISDLVDTDEDAIPVAAKNGGGGDCNHQP